MKARLTYTDEDQIEFYQDAADYYKTQENGYQWTEFYKTLKDKYFELEYKFQELLEKANDSPTGL